MDYSDDLERLTRSKSRADTVWELLKQRMTIDEIAATVATEFDLPRKQAISETRELIDYFGKSEILTADSRITAVH